MSPPIATAGPTGVGSEATLTTTRIRPDTLYAWHGPSLLVVDNDGRCDPRSKLTGFYFREARYLSELRLEVDGRSPWLCEVGSPSQELIEIAYVHPEEAHYGGGGSGQAGSERPQDARGLPQRALDLRLSYRVAYARLQASLLVTNRESRPLEFDVSWAVGADFADLLEAQGEERQQQAPVSAEVEPQSLVFRYDHERLPYRTRVRVSGEGGWTAEDGRIRSHLRLEPRQTSRIELEVIAVDFERDHSAEEIARRERAWDLWRSGLARVEVPGNTHAQHVIERAVDDLASFPLLEGAEDEWLALQAGMPLYPALFARDAMTACWQATLLDHGLALEAALTRLGRLQGDGVDE